MVPANLPQLHSMMRHRQAVDVQRLDNDDDLQNWKLSRINHHHLQPVYDHCWNRSPPLNIKGGFAIVTTRGRRISDSSIGIEYLLRLMLLSVPWCDTLFGFFKIHEKKHKITNFRKICSIKERQRNKHYKIPQIKRTFPYSFVSVYCLFMSVY